MIFFGEFQFGVRRESMQSDRVVNIRARFFLTCVGNRQPGARSSGEGHENRAPSSPSLYNNGAETKLLK